MSNCMKNSQLALIKNHVNPHCFNQRPISHWDCLLPDWLMQQIFTVVNGISGHWVTGTKWLMQCVYHKLQSEEVCDYQEDQESEIDWQAEKMLCG